MAERIGGASPSWGVIVGVAMVAGVTAAAVPVRDDVSPAGPALALVVPVVVASIAGHIAAITTAIAATAALNLAFLQPYWTFKIDAWEDWVALVVFLGVALVVARLVATATDRRRTAEQRSAELEALHARLELLDSERRRLAQDATRIEVLERVDEQRAALLRSVSHDLRTPLSTIRAVATDLRDGAAYDEPTREELLGIVCDEAERLDRLVANLLSLSRIEAGALRPERQAVAMDELVASVLQRLGGLFRSVRVQNDVSPDTALVDGDYVQLDQVLSNLLENAARHAPPSSTVTVAARTREGWVEVAVADEGIGVPQWEQERIFEPFRRGEGSSSSGIGLAICKAIVEGHGGSIRVERTPGGGATFVFTVPTRSGGPDRGR